MTNWAAVALTSQMILHFARSHDLQMKLESFVRS